MTDGNIIPQGDGPLNDAYRAALELVREGLAIPHAATVGDDEKRAGILQERMAHVLLMVGAILAAGNGRTAEWELGYCREKLAEHPATGYRVFGAQALEACAAPGCGHERRSHWEHSEPEGPRTGCGILGCECRAWEARHGS